MIRAGRDPEFDDWDGLLALLRAAFAYMEGRVDPPSSLNRLDAAGLREKAREEILITARQEDGALAGCLFAKPKADALYVGKMAAAPGSQGRGIGRALMGAAEREARALGLPALELATRIELVENHAAFARMGFRETERTAHPGFDRATSVTMRREVPASPAA